MSLGVLLSLGVVGWAARGITLMTSVLVSSPAWRSYDLLPVLRRRREDADWGDDAEPPADDAFGPAAEPTDPEGPPTGRRDHPIPELT